MKRGMIVAGLCAGMWLCGSVWGQETVVTNLLVNGTLRQDVNSEASGDFSAAMGFESVASGPFSHAEGAVTTASGLASHAEGGGTLAEGENSHAEGLATEALAENSHAGGAYARVRAQDSNAFIHATGTASNGMKETQFPDAAHFDHLVTLAPALNASNAVLSRAENDRRYLVVTNGVMGGELNMDESSIRNVSVIDGFGNFISFEEHMTSGTNIWGNWNADLLDGSHAASFATTQQMAQKMSVTGGWAASSINLISADRTQIKLGGDGNIDLVGGEETVDVDNMHIRMRWDLGADEPAEPSIELKPYYGAALRGLMGSDRWWTDGRFSATNSGKTSQFFAVNSGRFIGDGSGLVNLPTNAYDGRYLKASGDTMIGDFSLAGSLILLPTTEDILNPGFQTDGDVTMHWMTESGTYFKYGATGGEGDRFHFGSDGEFKAWGNVYSLADLIADRDLAVGGRGRVQYDPEIGTNQYALWVRNIAETSNDARGLLVTTPEYNGAEGIIFHAASMAGQSMASRFIVGTDGNVGVGVNDPQNRLHVAGDARVSGNLLMLDGQNIISPNFSTNTWGSGFDAWGPNAYLKYGFVRELLVAQNAEFQSRVKIGTSSDYAILNVGAPTNLVTPTYAARFESALGANSDKARGVLINFPNTTNPSSILFHAMSGPGPYTNSRVVIKADGKVGIGTSYPEATLHIHGDLRVDGAFSGDGSGLTNLPVTGLTTNAADARYVNVSGDAMTGTLSVAGGISSEGITLTRSGAANLSMVNDGDYPLLRNAYSEIWFGTPGDQALWFNYAAGTNVYFGDVNNLQNVCMYGDLHVTGTLNGNGAGLTNLPVTGLTTNAADTRYVNASGDAMSGGLTSPVFSVQSGSTEFMRAYTDGQKGIIRFGYQSDSQGLTWIPTWTSFTHAAIADFPDFAYHKKIWSEANDGSGSGLDADLLDGYHADDFATAAQIAEYLPLSGGIIHGTIWLTNANIRTELDGTGSTVAGSGNQQAIKYFHGGHNISITELYSNESIGQRQCIIAAEGVTATMVGDIGQEQALRMGMYSKAHIKGSGAKQLGYIGVFATATNLGNGAIQLLDLESGQSAITTSQGDGSLLLGAGTVSNEYAIVAGDGNVSHGTGSITANSFYGDGSALSGLITESGGTSTGPISLAGSSEQTNLFVAGWAKIDYIPPQGGISMGVYTNR